MKKFFVSMLLVLIATVVSVAQVSVIANKSVSESSVSSVKVSSIFSLVETKWSDGSKIVVFDQNSDAKKDFYTGIGKDQLSMKKDWMKKQLTGEAKAPETVASDAEVLAKVSSTPGSIGYVNSSSVSGGVKVLLEIK